MNAQSQPYDEAKTVSKTRNLLKNGESVVVSPESNEIEQNLSNSLHQESVPRNTIVNKNVAITDRNLNDNVNANCAIKFEEHAKYRNIYVQSRDKAESASQMQKSAKNEDTFNVKSSEIVENITQDVSQQDVMNDISVNKNESIVSDSQKDNVNTNDETKFEEHTTYRNIHNLIDYIVLKRDEVTRKKDSSHSQ